MERSPKDLVIRDDRDFQEYLRRYRVDKDEIKREWQAVRRNGKSGRTNGCA